MCTVTFFCKGEENFILTSNRDEAPKRKTLLPAIHEVNGSNMLFPKDELAGGTWIGSSDCNRTVCLLNGAFENHVRQGSYKKSRGVVVKEFLAANTIIPLIEGYDFSNIEPFTLIIVDWNKGLQLFELVWDGTEKHFGQLPLEPRIWSSSSLYNSGMKRMRKRWFSDFLMEKECDEESILYFHHTAGQEDKNTAVLMDRGFVKTVSITQVHKLGVSVYMNYENIATGEVAKTSLEQIYN